MSKRKGRDLEENTKKMKFCDSVTSHPEQSSGNKTAGRINELNKLISDQDDFIRLCQTSLSKAIAAGSTENIGTYEQLTIGAMKRIENYIEELGKLQPPTATATSTFSGGTTSSSVKEYETLEDFLFELKFDNPTAEHRRSPLAYIQWGRERNLVTVYCNRELPFTGREEVIDEIFEHAFNVLMKPNDKGDMAFIQASPGVGKTRLLNEIVDMSDDLKTRLIDRWQSEAKVSCFNNLLPVLISFNGNTSIGTKERKHEKEGHLDRTFRYAIRIIFTWLTNHHNFSSFYDTVANMIKTGQVRNDLFSYKTIFQLISEHAGGLIPYLLIDELSRLLNNEMGIEGSDISTISELQDGLNPSSKVVTCYSALKIGVFNEAQTESGRKIKPIPLPLFSIKEMKAPLQVISSNDINAFLKNEQSFTFEQVVEVMAEVSGGHFRSLEDMVMALRLNTNAVSLRALIILASNSYVGQHRDEYRSIAILICLFGRRVPPLIQFVIPEKNDKRNAINVEDLAVSGLITQTLASLSVPILPTMSSLQLIYWAKNKKNDTVSNPILDPLIKHVNTIVNIVLGVDMDGEPFERFNFARHKFMPSVYTGIMECALDPFTIDWRNASLASYFNVDEEYLSNNIRGLRFDFTSPISLVEYQSNSNLPGYILNCYNKKLSSICIPKSQGFPVVDYFILFVSLCGQVVVIPCQDKWSRKDAKTSIKIVEIMDVLNDAVDLTVSYGIPQKYIVAVGELWRVTSPKVVTREVRPASGSNIIIQTRDDLESLYGPVLTELLKLSELMNFSRC